MNRIPKALAASAAVTLAVLAGSIAPSDAAPTTSGYLSIWHQPRDGYHITTAAGDNTWSGRRGDWVKACGGSQACRTNVLAHFRSLRHDWRTFNAELWALQPTLPGCATPLPNGTPEVDCAAPAFGGTTRFHLDGRDYYAQTSTTPAA